MVGGIHELGITTQFAVLGANTNATFFNTPVSVAGYLRSLGLYNTATAPNGSVGRIGHIVNQIGAANSIVPHGVSVFSGQAAGAYQDTVTVARVEAGDYYSLRTFRESTTVTSAIGSWSAEFVPDGTAAPLFGMLQATLALSSTNFLGLVGSTSAIATETEVGMPVPFTMTLSRFCVTTSTAQSATGSLVLTVRDSGLSTSLAITIPAGGALGLYCNLSNTASLTGGTDWTAIQVVNNATVASADVQGWTVAHAAASGTLWAVCGTAGIFVGSGTTAYWAPLTASANIPEISATIPYAGRNAATATNFYVYIGGAAGGAGSNTVFTVRENLAASAMTVTVAGVGTGIFAGTGTLAFTQGETFSLQFAQTGGVNSGIMGGFCFSIAP